MLLLTDAATGRDELAHTALQRASMCENLAPTTSTDPQAAFTVGLLSLLDALLDCPLTEALAELPIHQILSDAILEQKGQLGDVLERVLAYEHGDFATATRPPLNSQALTHAYFQAIEWSTQLLGQNPH
jgi:c-di-GMP phosphodiesterase